MDAGTAAAVGGTIITGLGVVGAWIGSWINGQFASVRSSVKLLFEKKDFLDKDLQAYKLHVAETYVNQQALEKLFAPIDRRLLEIENTLRGTGGGDRR